MCAKRHDHDARPDVPAPDDYGASLPPLLSVLLVLPLLLVPLLLLPLLLLLLCFLLLPFLLLPSSSHSSSGCDGEAVRPDAQAGHCVRSHCSSTGEQCDLTFRRGSESRAPCGGCPWFFLSVAGVARIIGCVAASCGFLGAVQRLQPAGELVGRMPQFLDR